MNRKVIGPRLVLLGLGIVALTGMLIAQDEPDDEGTKGIFDQLSIAKDEPPPEQEGVQAQAMGMVHEAFASPTVFTANVGNPVDTEPPQAIEEMPPEHKPDGDNVQWINGYFAYEEQKKDFYWVSGIWRNIPPSMEWVPGTWNRIAQGWVYYTGFWRRASEGEMSVVPMPPEPLQTADPPSPGADSTYVPGSWVYKETRYVWRPACWAPYRAGWVWVPARYVLTHCGWTFVDGYWDYVIRDRGLLYCPVYISATYYRRPGFIYRPVYVVHDHALLSCLFVNRRTGCYVFGDYYDDYYRRSGYVSWTSYRVNRTYHEPLFSHYRYVNRRDPRWEINLVALQVARYRGVTPRPAVTIIQQKTVINKNITQINNLTLIAPATKINKKVVPMHTLNAAQVKTHQESAKQLSEATKLRAKNETNLAKSFGTVKVGDAPKTLALNLPKTTNTTVVTTKIKNLPPPPTGQKSQLPVGVGSDKGVVTKDKTPATDKTVVVKDKTVTDKVVLPKDKVVVPKDKAPVADKVVAPKDKVVVPKDKVPAADKLPPPKDKVVPVKDKVPAADKVVVPKDKVPAADKLPPPKDKVIPLKDKAPAADKVVVPKDKVPAADKLPPPMDKVVPLKDKAPAADKVILPKDKVTPVKDKGVTTDKAVTDKVTPAKDKDKAKDKAKDKGSVANPLNIRRTGAIASPRLEAAWAAALTLDRRADVVHFASRSRLS